MDDYNFFYSKMLIINIVATIFFFPENGDVRVRSIEHNSTDVLALADPAKHKTSERLHDRTVSDKVWCGEHGLSIFSASTTVHVRTNGS